MTLINTMSQAGYMTILFVIILGCIGLCVLLYFFSRHERKRFKDSRNKDTAFKPVDFDNELKKRVTDASGKTKFTLISFYIENAHGVKQIYSAQNVDGMLDVVATRLKRVINQSCSVAVQERKQITLFVSKHIQGKELINLVNKAIAEVRMPIAMPDSRQVYLELNVASVYYPGDGTEPVRLLNNLQVAVATARRKGLSQYVAYDQSIEGNTHSLGSYYEYQRQMIARNVGIYFRRVIEEGSLKSIIVEGQMRYRREEMNNINILQSAIATGDELWLGRFYYEHAMSQLKRINDKTIARKKLILRLSSSQMQDSEIVGQLVKATGNNGLATEDIIVGVDCTRIAEFNKDLSEFVKKFKDENFGLLLYNTTISQRADQLTALGVDYLEIDAHALIDSTAIGVGSYLDELRAANIAVIAGGVDKADYVKALRDVGIRLLLGDVLSTYLTVREIISN